MSNTRSSGFGDDANISRWINTPPSSDDESIELSLLRKPKSAILDIFADKRTSFRKKK
jgi:hypothetical protein